MKASQVEAWMNANHVRKIARYDALDRFSVVLTDGRLGHAPTVGEALAEAVRPDAENILRAA